MVKDAGLKKTDKFDMSEAYKKPSLYGTVLTGPVRPGVFCPEVPNALGDIRR